MMSAESPEEEVVVSYDNIRCFIREHQDPCVTASEVADQFDITNQGALYRLRQLSEQGDVGAKEAGASAKVWYLTV